VIEREEQRPSEGSLFSIYTQLFEFMLAGRGEKEGPAAGAVGPSVSSRDAAGYPTSSRIAFFTFVGTGAYFSGSITLDARPWLIERSSVV
jgi:hypothetical protein